MKNVIIIGIAGGSGSGKTTLARNIAEHFGDRIAVIRHDDYYKAHDNISLAERALINYDHPQAFDTELLVSHLKALKEGKSIDCPIYDYTVHNRSDRTRRVESRPVILIEGILILENPEVVSLLDMKIYVDTDADVRIIRRIRRDTRKRGRSLDSVIKQYLDTVKPMHDAFVEPTKRLADVIVPEGGKNPVAYGMIIDRIEKFL
ncbi:MAG: uridine kinase [Clostridia bacterium]|nr:uridine kinase [Clostridia bacterium]